MSKKYLAWNFNTSNQTPPPSIEAPSSTGSVEGNSITFKTVDSAGREHTLIFEIQNDFNFNYDVTSIDYDLGQSVTLIPEFPTKELDELEDNLKRQQIILCASTTIPANQKILCNIHCDDNQYMLSAGISGGGTSVPYINKVYYIKQIKNNDAFYFGPYDIAIGNSPKITFNAAKTSAPWN